MAIRFKSASCAILFVGVALLAVAQVDAASQVVFPGRTWDSRQPSEVGMDSTKLRAVADLVGGNGCVVRHGRMVASWGKWREPSDVASATKPVCSHFLFKAIENGRIGGLDDPVARVEERLNNINGQLGHKDRGITWRNMANQTACYGVSESPGAAFVYNDWQMALFFDSLFLNVYGSKYAEVDEKVFRPMLADLLGCEDAPALAAPGRNGRLAISPRDFARFGLLYLRGGVWQGRQLISPGFVRMATTDPLPNSIPRTSAKAAEMIPGQRTMGSRIVPDDQTDHKGSYSWLWWVNGIDRNGKRNWPDAPLDTYAALGHGGQEGMMVVPSLDIVVSWNGSRVPEGATNSEALRLLVGAVSDADPASEQIVADSKSPSRLVRRGGRRFFMCGPGDPEGFLYRGKLRPDGTRDGDQVHLIEKLAASGANSIYVIAVRSHGGDGDSTHNPFIDNDPGKGINEKVLDQWDQWFALMDRCGIVVFLIVYDDDASVWNTGSVVCAAEQEFIRGLVARLKNHRNLIWCIAEEYQEALTPERVRRLAAIIRQADDCAHPIAVHKLPGLSFSEFADDPNIDQFAVQCNVKSARELHEGMLKARSDAKGRYNINMAECEGFGTGAELRAKLWACAMTGAYVMVLGMDIARTPVSDLEDCGRVVRFMESVDCMRMSPRDDLVSGTTKYAMTAPEGDFILYSDRATGNLGLKNPSEGMYELNWFDCASGRWVIQPHVNVTGARAAWAKPSGLGDEIALYARYEIR